MPIRSSQFTTLEPHLLTSSMGTSSHCHTYPPPAGRPLRSSVDSAPGFRIDGWVVWQRKMPLVTKGGGGLGAPACA